MSRKILPEIIAHEVINPNIAYQPNSPQKSYLEKNNLFTDTENNIIRPQLAKPEWNPDFSERINVEDDSINLALETLSLSRYDYNLMDINQLRNLRRIDSSNSTIYALNILIYYKKNSKLTLPQISPIKHKWIYSDEKKVEEKKFEEKKIEEKASIYDFNSYKDESNCLSDRIGIKNCLKSTKLVPRLDID